MLDGNICTLVHTCYTAIALDDVQYKLISKMTLCYWFAIALYPHLIIQDESIGGHNFNQVVKWSFPVTNGLAEDMMVTYEFV